MVCELDEKNWCKNHKMFHQGISRDRALDPGPEGQKWRRAWDKVNFENIHDQKGPCVNLGKRVRDNNNEVVKQIRH